MSRKSHLGLAGVLVSGFLTSEIGHSQMLREYETLEGLAKPATQRSEPGFNFIPRVNVRYFVKKDGKYIIFDYSKEKLDVGLEIMTTNSQSLQFFESLNERNRISEGKVTFRYRF